MAAAAAMMPASVHAQSGDPLIIAHRGASGERPEHTLEAYDLAIDQGADYIEPDLVVTKDGVLVARHENEISGTTDVAARPEFAERKRTKSIDGNSVTGWFAEDFTLAELRTLRARERLPQIRPANARFDGLYQVPTFAEVIALVRAREALSGKRIGLYPELKHPAFLTQETGIDTAALLVEELDRAGLTPDDPVFIQSFEVAPLRQLNASGEWKLVLLMAPEGGPADTPSLSYAAMARPAGLAEVAQYADAIGVAIPMVLNANGSATSLVADAHAAGLQVHAWTLRKENAFLPPALRFGDDPSAAGNLPALWALLKGAQVDGVFTDDPLPTSRAKCDLSVQLRE
ncbi:MAG: glycerophosphodiester phosphodiesterase [Allopontixanthobacter sp.]|nr:glycerophosphodiester phosphodiesterase [Allopontixanthobacter sp.]MDZ4306814.1 glycerophosphodiester phosphodiesterase [Allopontixanthobacter sp.]